jgi:hypothetical protein
VSHGLSHAVARNPRAYRRGAHATHSSNAIASGTAELLGAVAPPSKAAAANEGIGKWSSNYKRP